MSIANWGWKHYHGKEERSMAYYLAHPDADDPDEPSPCEECDGTGQMEVNEPVDESGVPFRCAMSCWYCCGTGEKP